MSLINSHNEICQNYFTNESFAFVIVFFYIETPNSIPEVINNFARIFPTRSQTKNHFVLSIIKYIYICKGLYVLIYYICDVFCTHTRLFADFCENQFSRFLMPQREWQLHAYKQSDFCKYIYIFIYVYMYIYLYKCIWLNCLMRAHAHSKLYMYLKLYLLNHASWCARALSSTIIFAQNNEYNNNKNAQNFASKTMRNGKLQYIYRQS